MKTATFDGIDLDAAKERLKQSKKEYQEMQVADGTKAGREWAANTAEAGELIALAQWKQQAGSDWDACFLDNDDNAYTVAARFVFSVRPEDDGSRVVAHEFWEQQGFEHNHPVGDYVRGFAERRA